MRSFTNILHTKRISESTQRSSTFNVILSSFLSSIEICKEMYMKGEQSI